MWICPQRPRLVCLCVSSTRRTRRAEICCAPSSGALTNPASPLLPRQDRSVAPEERWRAQEAPKELGVLWRNEPIWSRCHKLGSNDSDVTLWCKLTNLAYVCLYVSFDLTCLMYLTIFIVRVCASETQVDLIWIYSLTQLGAWCWEVQRCLFI